MSIACQPPSARSISSSSNSPSQPRSASSPHTRERSSGDPSMVSEKQALPAPGRHVRSVARHRLAQQPPAGEHAAEGDQRAHGAPLHQGLTAELVDDRRQLRGPGGELAPGAPAPRPVLDHRAQGLDHHRVAQLGRRGQRLAGALADHGRRRGQPAPRRGLGELHLVQRAPHVGGGRQPDPRMGLEARAPARDVQQRRVATGQQQRRSPRRGPRSRARRRTRAHRPAGRACGSARPPRATNVRAPPGRAGAAEMTSKPAAARPRTAATQARVSPSVTSTR